MKNSVIFLKVLSTMLSAFLFNINAYSYHLFIKVNYMLDKCRSISIIKKDGNKILTGIWSYAEFNIPKNRLKFFDQINGKVIPSCNNLYDKIINLSKQKMDAETRMGEMDEEDRELYADNIYDYPEERKQEYSKCAKQCDNSDKEIMKILKDLAK